MELHNLLSAYETKVIEFLYIDGNFVMIPCGVDWWVLL
jgi:hypothetical protein